VSKQVLVHLGSTLHRQLSQAVGNIPECRAIGGAVKYRKKPCVIEAIQFDGSKESLERINAWSGLQWGLDGIIIPTLEGTMNAAPGDWIIKGVAGEFYNCRDDIFQLTYEPVDVAESESGDN